MNHVLSVSLFCVCLAWSHGFGVVLLEQCSLKSGDGGVLSCYPAPLEPAMELGGAVTCLKKGGKTRVEEHKAKAGAGLATKVRGGSGVVERFTLLFPRH